MAAAPRRRPTAPAALALAAALLVGASAARAEPAERPLDDPSGTDFIATTERDEDPLGIETGMHQELESAADARDELARAQADRPALTARQGQVLSAIGAVREGRHEVWLRWAQGLEQVRVHIDLESRSRFAAEVAYRLPLPAGARVVSVAVCESATCHPGQLAEDAPARYLHVLPRPNPDPAPALLATRVVDARGHALSLRVAPLRAGGTLQLRVTYGLERPVQGGVVRLELPARGLDPRIAPTLVHLEAPDLALDDGQAGRQLDAWLPLELPARFAPGGPSTRRLVAGGRVRHWQARALPAGAGEPQEWWVFVDRSPSMEGPARGRVLPTLHALRDSLAPGSRLRVAVFDARAVELPDASSDDFDSRLQQALLQPAGAKTRLSSALELSRAWQPSDLPVRAAVLTDGRLSDEHGELSALQRFSQRQIPVWLVALEAPRFDPSQSRLLGPLRAGFVDVSDAADRALRERESGPLHEALSVLVHGGPGSPATPGEQQVRWTRTRRRGVQGDATFAALLAQGPDAPWTTLDADADQGLWPAHQPAAQAVPYEDAPPTSAPAPTGMPAESVLALLRDQLVPPARACLRRDRRGRGDYAVRAAFEFRLERREILDARVRGELEPALRRCLRDVLADLDVPAFSGRLTVRYPIYTQRAPEPPQIELEPDTAARLERLFQSERPPPPPAGLSSPDREAW